MRTVILTRGVSGSGKSTWAKQQVLAHPDQYVRINKDSLRYMLFGGVFTSDHEYLVECLRDEAILIALKNGFDPIVDDTHTKPRHEKHIRMLVAGIAQVQIQDFSHVPLYICIKRDAQRPTPLDMQEPTGEAMIRKQWDQLQQYTQEIV